MRIDIGVILEVIRLRLTYVQSYYIIYKSEYQDKNKYAKLSQTKIAISAVALFIVSFRLYIFFLSGEGINPDHGGPMFLELEMLGNMLKSF